MLNPKVVGIVALIATVTLLYFQSFAAITQNNQLLIEVRDVISRQGGHTSTTTSTSTSTSVSNGNTWDTTVKGKAKAQCPWEFVEYKMSPYEKMWVDHGKEWGDAPCDRFKLDNNDVIAEQWHAYTDEYMKSSINKPANTTIFSMLTYKRSCTSELVHIPIEPLALLMRNPLICGFVGANGFRLQENMFDKNYMVMDWEIQRQREDSGGRVFFFDAGASLFNSGIGGASQSWFVSEIERRGLTLDGIFAWEYTVHDAKNVFADIPQRLWPIYRWYNIPVSNKIGSLDNPWEMMIHLTTPEDMVIVKLDVDTPQIEVNLIKQILANTSISSRIDWLFYEDHPKTKEMIPVYEWELSRFVTDYKTSIDFFVHLREKGIRAHPWV